MSGAPKAGDGHIVRHGALCRCSLGCGEGRLIAGAADTEATAADRRITPLRDCLSTANPAAGACLPAVAVWREGRRALPRRARLPSTAAARCAFGGWVTIGDPAAS